MSAVLFNDIICPLSELYSQSTLKAGADCDYHFEIVAVCLVLSAVGENCFHFGNTSIFLQFTTLQNILDVLADGWNVHAEGLGHLLLRRH